MISAAGEPKVIEYNCRFGDPETQPIMVRLKSDLVDLCLQALDGKLDQAQAQWDDRCAIGVVLAAGGYPASYDKGATISGLDAPQNDNIKVFHAGTSASGEELVTSGGRVLCVTALGDCIATAQKDCYQAADKISWEGMILRRDIGWRAIQRYSQSRQDN
jgi:phosphoribosylamine--glycine ligase